MNIELLRRIQRQIDKAPERFIMSCVRQSKDCGTAYCIAGWALALSADNRFEGDKFNGMPAARKLLGIDKTQSDRLFHVHNWPKQFQANHCDSPQFANARIDHFLATNGAE